MKKVLLLLPLFCLACAQPAKEVVYYPTSYDLKKQHYQEEIKKDFYDFLNQAQSIMESKNEQANAR